MTNLTLNINTPSTKTGRTKSDVTDRIRNMLRFSTVTFSSVFGNCIANDTQAVAYCLEKRRPVKTQSKRAMFTGLKGDIRKTAINEKGYWIAKAYVFNIKDLEAAGLKIDQCARTFKLVDANKNKMSLQDYKNMNR